METMITTETLDIASPSLAEVVWVNPNRVSGAPCFINTRVPIQHLFDYLEAGHTLEDFLEGFPPVTREQALTVLTAAKANLINSLSLAA